MAEKAQLRPDAAGPLTTEEILADGSPRDPRRRRGTARQSKIPAKIANCIDGEKAAEFYRELNRLNSAALCLSGGGIRSAAFALGVIQALATHPRPLSEPNKSGRSESDSLLARFHYLSTVSGGGYIGGWLSAWISRADDGFKTVWKNLVCRPRRP